MKIIGAGMAGLLASAMLRDSCSLVIEAQNGLPNNHSAVLRFRSHVVGDVLNIRFKEVSVIKATEEWVNPAADAMAYSYKTTGQYEIRSIASADGQLTKRYIAPPDLIQRMFKSCMSDFAFGIEVGLADFITWAKRGETVISTLPMPALMKILDYPGPQDEFHYKSGTNINCTLPMADAYCSLYIPDPYFPAYRISLTGNRLTIECVGEVDDPIALRMDCLQKLGIPRKTEVSDMVVSTPRYNKILPISDRVRKQFIMWATEHYNVYSLGRFATWRPGLLLDDVVNDVRVIQKIVDEGNYDHRK